MTLPVPMGSKDEPAHGVFYLLLCRECGDPERPLPIPFESPAARGKWAAEHTRLTGHDRWWVKDARPPLESQSSPASGGRIA